MQELGLKTTYIQAVLDGIKTVEGRLGTPKHLRLRAGDTISLREDIWQDGEIVRSVLDRAQVKITQILYFETFEEMLNSIDARKAVPDAADAREALAAYRQFYTAKDEEAYGVMAITFTLVA